MAKKPKPPQEPAPSSALPPPPKRIFVVQVTAKGNQNDVVGYAITEQVGFIDLKGQDLDHNLVDVRIFEDGLRAVFDSLARDKYVAVGIPSDRNEHGGGYTMFSRAANGTSAKG